MRPVFAPLLALLIVHQAHSFENPTDFPYQANVGKDNVLVRSGPGGRYYPTGRLSAGDRVTVHRHDPGGWFMVSPPQGSFSWIQADGVQVNGTTATVTATSLPVRVGSRFDDGDRNVISRRLSRGETVQVTGQGQDESGQQLLKIVPPRLEYRWVSGGVLAPLAKPDANRSGSTAEKPSIKTTAATVAPPGANSPNPPARQDVNFENSPIDKRPYETLKTLDTSFGRIVGDPPNGWSFKQLEADYQKLMQSTNIPGFRTLVRRRLAAITRYRQYQKTIQEVQTLAKTTNRRDAAIRQAGHQVVRPAPAQPQPAQPQPAQPQPAPSRPTTSAGPRPQPAPQFSGAGIVRPIATGHPRLPSFVLVAPDGRLLTFLRPAPGINLASWVNRSVGLTGPRGFQPDLQADLLQINSIHPVRLRR